MKKLIYLKDSNTQSKDISKTNDLFAKKDYDVGETDTVKMNWNWRPSPSKE